MRPITTMLFAAALALVGCTATPPGAADSERQEGFELKDYSPASLAVPMAARGGLAAATGHGALFPRSSTGTSMVIRTGQTSIEVDSLERALAQVRLLAGRIGGYVANTTMQTGRGQLRSATLEVKIPADRFDDGLGGLSALGKLESVNVNAEDVGEEFTDVTARMGNARRLEVRLIELLATRTGKLKDVLDVEHELARVGERRRGPLRRRNTSSQSPARCPVSLLRHPGTPRPPRSRLTCCPKLAAVGDIALWHGRADGALRRS